MGGFSKQPGRSGAGWGRGGFRKGSAHKVCHRIDLSEGVSPRPRVTSARTRRQEPESMPLAAIEEALRTISAAAAGAVARQAAARRDPEPSGGPFAETAAGPFAEPVAGRTAEPVSGPFAEPEASGAPPTALPEEVVVDAGDPAMPWQERLRTLFSSLAPRVGGSGAASDLEQAVLQVIAQEIERSQERLIEENRELTPAARIYERRIAKLNQALEETQERLRRMAAMRDVDQGIASIYEAVQGLDDNEEFAAFKKELMARIFEANVKLKEAREHNA